MRASVESVRSLSLCRKFTRFFLSILLAALVVGLPAAVSGSPPRDTPTSALVNDPPEILSFSARPSTGNYWIFKGRVSDEDPAGCIVVFGGLLQGVSVPVEEDGTFTYVREFPPGTSGGVTAQAFDDADQGSNVAESYVG